MLRNLTMSPLHKRRQRRGRLGLPGEAGLEGAEPSDALGPDDKKDGDLDTDELLKGEGEAGDSQGVPKERECARESGVLGGAALLLLVPLKPLWSCQMALWQGTGLSVLGWQDDKVKRVHASDPPPPSLTTGGVEHMECEMKLEGPVSPDVEPGREETEESKKRKRKPYRPGEGRGRGGVWRGMASQLPSSFSASSLPPHRHRRFHGATAEIPHTCEKGACCTGGGVEWGWAARRG